MKNGEFSATEKKQIEKDFDEKWPEIAPLPMVASTTMTVVSLAEKMIEDESTFNTALQSLELEHDDEDLKFRAHIEVSAEIAVSLRDREGAHLGRIFAALMDELRRNWEKPKTCDVDMTEALGEDGPPSEAIYSKVSTALKWHSA